VLIVDLMLVQNMNTSWAQRARYQDENVVVSYFCLNILMTSIMSRRNLLYFSIDVYFSFPCVDLIFLLLSFPF